jgi:hypothetical protein
MSIMAFTPPAEPQETQPAEPAPARGKLGLIIELLRRPEGADLSAMMTATGWQQHSVRGALAGALKKKRGLTIVSEKTEGVRIYRIAEPVDEPPSPAPKRGRRSGKPVGEEAGRG